VRLKQYFFYHFPREIFSNFTLLHHCAQKIKKISFANPAPFSPGAPPAPLFSSDPATSFFYSSEPAPVASSEPAPLSPGAPAPLFPSRHARLPMTHLHHFPMAHLHHFPYPIFTIFH
jgi:hypothetical protein